MGRGREPGGKGDQSECHNTMPCEGIMWDKKSICEPREKN